MTRNTRTAGIAGTAVAAVAIATLSTVGTTSAHATGRSVNVLLVGQPLAAPQRRG